MSEEKYRQSAFQIITNYFGKDTAKMYNDDFEGKSSEEIKQSLERILNDAIGRSLAEKIIQDFVKLAS